MMWELFMQLLLPLDDAMRRKQNSHCWQLFSTCGEHATWNFCPPTFEPGHHQILCEGRISRAYCATSPNQHSNEAAHSGPHPWPPFFQVLFAEEQLFIFVCNVVMHIRQILRLAPFKAILPGNSAFEGPKNVETAFKVALLNVHVKHKISFYWNCLQCSTFSSQHTAFLFFVWKVMRQMTVSRFSCDSFSLNMF